MRFFKTLLGVILCIFAFAWSITAIAEKQALWLIGTGVCTALAVLLFRKTKKEKAKFHELLKTLELGLEDRMTSKVGLLSGGQRQAVTLLMASLQKPKLLLLDEHTAALDPKTAAKVLELTDKIIEENHLTAMMVTHNMRDAIAHGNRLIMMNNGRVILNISGEEKKKLTVEDLLVKFEEVSGEEFDSDKALLG